MVVDATRNGLSLLLLGRRRVNDLLDTVDRKTVVVLEGSSSFAEILIQEMAPVLLWFIAEGDR